MQGYKLLHFSHYRFFRQNLFEFRHLVLYIISDIIFFTNDDAGITLGRLGEMIPMHEWPPCMYRHIFHPPTPGVCGVDGFLDPCWKWDDDSIVHTNTAILHM